MKLEQAKEIAERYVETLSPCCERIEIAGSIRRERPDVKDIEIVAIPKIINTKTDLFHQEPTRHQGFVHVVDSLEKIKGDAATGKYTQRKLPEGINLDLFMATKDNWGAILLIRTGDANFSKYFVSQALRKNGYKQEGGYVKRDGITVPVREEIDMFKLADMDFIQPPKRIGVP